MKILVVEDLPVDVKLARVVLTSAGHEVSEVESAERALAAIQAEMPELILVDVKLPGIPGVELVRRLKSDPATRSIPIIVVTAYEDVVIQEKAHEAGCDLYITKPIDSKRLVRQISDIESRY